MSKGSAQYRNLEWTAKDKLSKGCHICGYNKCARALHYHHDDKEDKTSSVAKLATTGKALYLVIEEANKCRVICANCHAEMHSDNRHPGWL